MRPNRRRLSRSSSRMTLRSRHRATCRALSPISAARLGSRFPKVWGLWCVAASKAWRSSIRWTLERLEELRGARIDTLYIVGGGTQNKLLNQFAADCLGRRVVCGPVEATAAGNVLTQLMARGELAGVADARAVVRRSFELEPYLPNEENRAAWNDASGRVLTVVQ